MRRQLSRKVGDRPSGGSHVLFPCLGVAIPRLLGSYGSPISMTERHQARDSSIRHFDISPIFSCPSETGSCSGSVGDRGFVEDEVYIKLVSVTPVGVIYLHHHSTTLKPSTTTTTVTPFHYTTTLTSTVHDFDFDLVINCALSGRSTTTVLSASGRAFLLRSCCNTTRPHARDITHLHNKTPHPFHTPEPD